MASSSNRAASSPPTCAIARGGCGELYQVAIVCYAQHTCSRLTARYTCSTAPPLKPTPSPTIAPTPDVHGGTPAAGVAPPG
jgi:hypothetical protein